MKPLYLRRTLLVLMVAASGCATVFPPEVGPTAQILNSCYVTDEMRAAHADLNSGPLAKAIAEARK